MVIHPRRFGERRPLKRLPYGIKSPYLRTFRHVPPRKLPYGLVESSSRGYTPKNIHFTRVNVYIC